MAYLSMSTLQPPGHTDEDEEPRIDYELVVEPKIWTEGDLIDLNQTKMLR